MRRTTTRRASFRASCGAARRGGAEAFHDASYGHPADAGCLADHVAALQQPAQTRPWIKDFGLLVVPGAEHVLVDCLAYVRKRSWDFLVHELMGTRPPAYRPAPIPIDPELLGELFA